MLWRSSECLLLFLCGKVLLLLLSGNCLLLGGGSVGLLFLLRGGKVLFFWSFGRCIVLVCLCLYVFWFL